MVEKLSSDNVPTTPAIVTPSFMFSAASCESGQFGQLSGVHPAGGPLKATAEIVNAQINTKIEAIHSVFFKKPNFLIFVFKIQINKE